MSRHARKLVLAICAAAAGMSQLSAASAQQVSPERRNLVSLNHTATLEVVQDLMIVNLQVLKEGNSAGDVQTALKQVLDTALNEARKTAQAGQMDVHTGAFSIHPRYGNLGKISGWQGQAQLVLEGQDMARIAQAVGRISGMTVAALDYGLSRALREKNEAALTAQAISGFRARATEVAKAFGFGGFSLAEISVQSGDPGFQPRMAPMMMRAAAADVAAAPLPVEPGKGLLSVTIAGQVVLTP
jgi:predicted secreted protein